SGGYPVDRLSELLGHAVQFVYTCWDRIVLSGYIERLQRPENLIYFFQDVVGINAIEPAVLEQRANTYKAWVRRITDERVLWLAWSRHSNRMRFGTPDLPKPESTIED